MNHRTQGPSITSSGKRGELSRKILRAVKRQSRSGLPSVSLRCDDKETMDPTLARVLGPYPNAGKWRLVIREGTARKSVVYDTEEQALRARASLLSALDDRSSRTIGEVVGEYLSFKRNRGCVPRSIQTISDKLAWLPYEDSLFSITPERAEKLYTAQTENVAVCTQHKNLREAKAFFGYCVKQRYLTVNAFALVQSIGKANSGKPQLRQDEARKLSDCLIDCASQGEVPALALLVQVLLGLRSGEVLKLTKRDLDCGGSVLVIEGTKSKNAKRTLTLESPIVRELVARRVATLSAEALIFAPDGHTHPLTTTTLWKALRVYCKRAQVPEVCPHSLRGLHSSLAVQAGATSAYVAKALGHSSDAVTLKHYISTSALDSARSSRVSAALIGDLDVDALITALRTLPPAQLDRVCVSLGYCR